MSTLRVNNLESYTPGNPLNINDELQMTGSTATGAKSVAFGEAAHSIGEKSSVLGGYGNEASASFSAIVGGSTNVIKSGSKRSAILGGGNNVILNHIHRETP